MTYAIYCIHPETLTINLKSFYKDYKSSLEHLKNETEEYVKTNKNVNEVSYIVKKNDLEYLGDGYYLKNSNKYPNRITVYEKITKVDSGVFYNSSTINVRKTMVFSLLELSSMPVEIDLDIGRLNQPINKIATPSVDIVYLEELRKVLSEKRKRFEEEEEEDSD